MLIDAFMPAYQGTITLSVAAASAAAALPPGGEYLEIKNTSATLTVFVETGGPAIVATVASGYPVLPGQSRVIRRKRIGDSSSAILGQADTFIAALGSAAGPTTVYVTAGVGT